MKKLLSLIFAISLAMITLAQAPQGFNYQAVIRDIEGQPISEQQVSIRLTLQDEAGEAIHYAEKHVLNTSPQGLVSLVVGSGTPVEKAFTEVPWAEVNVYLMVEVDPTGGTSYSELGTTRLQAVPYALHAQSASSFVAEPGVGEDEPLFVVRNSQNQIVFAVYEKGVRMYVEDDAKEHKGNKSGFAIGGLTGFKQNEMEYFRVTPDSVRIFLREPTGKGNKGGFAIGGITGFKADTVALMFVATDSTRFYIDTESTGKGNKSGFAIGGLTGFKSGTPLNFFNVSADTTATIDPSEARILWYPNKNAFMAGQVLVESPDSVGTNSWASGYESKSIGNWSQALGFKAIARGNYSTAIGKNAIADGHNSFAFGDNTVAGVKNNVANNSYAFGEGSSATGNGGYAFGYHAKSTATDAFAIGTGTEASGEGSFAIGFIGQDSAGVSTGHTKAIADWAIAIGMGAQATEKGAFAMGTQAIASGIYSLAMGYKTNSEGWYSSALGNRTTASGWYSTSMGLLTVAEGTFSLAAGNRSRAEGTNSFAFGYAAVAKDIGSVAIGSEALANMNYSTAIGWRATASGLNSVAIGQNAQAAGYSVAIGISSQAHGNSFAFGQSVKAVGPFSTAIGYRAIANGSYSVAIGDSTIAPSGYETVLGRYNSIYDPQNSTGWNASDRLFVIGNGMGTTTRSNAITILKNGNFAIGSDIPTNRMQIRGRNDDTDGTTGVFVDIQNFNGNVNGRMSGIRFKNAPDNIGYKAAILFRRDQANGRGNIHFAINDENNTNEVTIDDTKMVLRRNGYLGLGVEVPTYRLELPNNTDPSGRAIANEWVIHSDKRIKSNIKEIHYGLEAVLELNPLSYFHHSSTTESGIIRIEKSGTTNIGLIAQHVYEVIPEVVSKPANDNSELWGISYEKLVPVLIKAIQEQQQIIEKQQTGLELFKAELEAIKSMIVK